MGALFRFCRARGKWRGYRRSSFFRTEVHGLMTDAWREARAHHDRCDASEGASHGGEPFKKGDVPRRIGSTRGGLNARLHTVCDGNRRPIIMLLPEGRMSDHRGARLVLDALPPATHLIAGRGYDSAWFRAELEAGGIEPCIPSSRIRNKSFNHDRVLYRQGHRIENLFAKLKD